MGLVILEDWLKKSPPLEKLDNPNSWHDRYMAIVKLRDVEGGDGSQKGKSKMDTDKPYCLMYWKNQDDKRTGKDPIRVIPIDFNNTIHVAPHPYWPDVYPHVLKFATSDRTFFFCAKDDLQKRVWLSKLMETINRQVLSEGNIQGKNNQVRGDHDDCTLARCDGNDNMYPPVEFFQQTSTQMQAISSRFQADNMVANVIIEDWLKKSPPSHKLTNHSSWHDRYMALIKITETGSKVARSRKGKTEISILNPFYLMYWRNQEEKRRKNPPIRIVPITQENSIHCIQHPYWSDVYPHVLKLNTNKRVFFLCAKDDIQKRVWLSAFRAAFNENIYEEARTGDMDSRTQCLSPYDSDDVINQTPRCSFSSSFSLDIDFIMSHWHSISKKWDLSSTKSLDCEADSDWKN